MSDKDFEKAVQQDLEELSLSPSDAVWNKVEATLPRKKNRRWILFLFPFLLGATFLSVWYYNAEGDGGELVVESEVNKVNKVYKVDKVYTGEVGEVNEVYKVDKVYTGGVDGVSEVGVEVNEVNKVNKVSEVNGTEVGEIDKVNKVNEVNKVNKVNKVDEVKVNEVNKVNKVSEGNDGKVYKVDKVYKGAEDRQVNKVNEGNELAKANIANKKNEKRREEAKENDLDRNLNISPLPDKKITDEQDLAKNSTETSTVINTVPEKDFLNLKEAQAITSDTIALDTTSKNTTQNVIGTADSITAPLVNKNDKKNKNYWKFGILAGAGISNIGEGLFNNNMEKSLFAPTSGSPIGGTGGQPPVQYEPSSSFSFTIGVYAEKEINRKLSFVAGLGYAYYSNIIKLQPVDTIMFRDYGEKYTNKYHFIQLPVTLQYIPFSKLPVYIEAGLNASYLIKSNALQYNSTNYSFTENKNDYTRFLIGMNAGVGANIKNVKLGYRLSYSLTSLSKSESVKQFPYSSMIYMQVPLKKY